MDSKRLANLRKHSLMADVSPAEKLWQDLLRQSLELVDEQAETMAAAQRTSAAAVGAREETIGQLRAEVAALRAENAELLVKVPPASQF